MGKKSKSKCKKSPQLKAECQLLALLSSTRDEEKVSMIMDVYGNFRRSKQLLSITAVCKITTELVRLREYSHIISIMVDHWSLLQKCTDGVINVFVYLTFTQACCSLSEFRKAARYSDSMFHTVLQSPYFIEQDHLLGKISAVQRYADKMSVVLRHANVRAKVGQFDDALVYFEMALEIQSTWKEESGNEKSPFGSTHYRARILADMASFLNMRSIVECGYVRKEDRHQTIETYRKAISLFLKSDMPKTNVNDDINISGIANYHCNIGIEYGKVRLWQKANKELKFSVDFLLQNRASLLSERKLHSCLVVSLGLLGWLWLQQYYESVFLGLSNTRSKQILNEAEGYTMHALTLLESFPMSKGHTCTTPQYTHFLLYVHAQQCYFLGKVDEAFANLPLFLEPYTSMTDFCHGCGQKHGEDEADKVINTCAGCKSVFYCNRLCQTRNWYGEGISLGFNHKFLCPLLRFWRKAGKKELDSSSVDNQSVEDAFRKHFETFRKK